MQNELEENRENQIRGSGLLNLGNSRDKHLHFLGAAPAQPARRDCGIAWAIPEMTDSILNPCSAASEIATSKYTTSRCDDYGRSN
ncbi:MAG: hypothetical protein DMG36_09640 [Acidobacteria bacterium]|nr:MAG: hypothetical protein DMG36_09640 [Acidobacteriota bacterium]